MTEADRKYEAAMAASDGLIERIRAEPATSSDPVRSLLISIWRRRHNVPFVATVFEATAEMAAPLEQTPEPR